MGALGMRRVVAPGASPAMAIYAAAYFVVCALVILLVVLPNSRRAYT